MALRRWIYAMASPAGARARLSILIFHRVLAAPDPLFPEIPTASRFREEMRWVRDWFHVLPLDEAVERLRDGRLPARAAAITFDDGYADNATVAAPILRELGMPATFFVTTGFLNGGRMWNDTVIETLRAFTGERIDLRELGCDAYPLAIVGDRRRAIDDVLRRLKHLDYAERLDRVSAIERRATGSLPRDLMLNTEQLRTLSDAPLAVGAHTRSHPILTRLAVDQARDEIQVGKAELEALIDRPVTLFAYPNGVPGQDYGPEHREIVARAGFTAAFSTAWGAADRQCDRFQLPRFTPWDRSRWRYGLRLLRNFKARPAVVGIA